MQYAASEPGWGPPVSSLFVVRHGLVHNPLRVAYGFLPRMGLAPAGREQARRAGQYLRERQPAALYHSPLLRARQTAALILEAMPHLPRHTSLLVRESELARVWQGTPIADRPARFPEEYRLFMEEPSRSVAGETMAAQAERMRRLVRRARARYPGGPVVIVSHRDPIVALRLEAEGRSHDQLHRTRCEPGSITAFQVDAAGGLQFTSYVEP